MTSTAIETIAEPRKARAVAIAQPADSITELLRLAVEKGTPVAELKELVDLHERMAKRQAEAEFFAAMAAFQAECPSIKKSSTAEIVSRRSGSKFQYSYAELSEIASVINPILATHGLSYSWDSVINAASITVICYVRHRAGHFITSSITLPTASEGAMNEQQKVGAALTFGQRRTLSSALGLTTTDEDNDAASSADPTPISDDQATVIADLITETATDKDRFLKFMGVDAIAKIPASDYQRAMVSLEQRKQSREKKAAAGGAQ